MIPFSLFLFSASNSESRDNVFRWIWVNHVPELAFHSVSFRSLLLCLCCALYWVRRPVAVKKTIYTLVCKIISVFHTASITLDPNILRFHPFVIGIYPTRYGLQPRRWGTSSVPECVGVCRRNSVSVSHRVCKVRGLNFKWMKLISFGDVLNFD